MYTIYNTGDVVFWKADETVALVLTNDGLYCAESANRTSGLAPINWLTKLIVQAARLCVIALDKIYKAKLSS